MCDGRPGPSEKPEESLRKLLASELDIFLDKTAIKLFIRAHWKDLRRLAHAVHGSEPPSERPMAEFVSAIEGGAWLPWWPHGFGPYGEPPVPRTVHAIKFKDGSVWDVVNGWRPAT